MKKLSLKMKGIGEMLSREQMKNVLGGRASEVEVEGGEGRKYQCCPGPGNGTVSCSECVFVPSGSHAQCTLGTLTAC
ncbi:hypothetical protein [Daejeonella sp.]|uniref:hypothetical protein n=1 Tax=Daejeonella sp. TaxID=2805397 RepID=UPI0025C2EA0B|nr:hypothetical protein [Daejeonella sp.]